MSWCTIESDPGVFTELIQTIGVKGVQVAELWDLEPETFEKIQPIYGLVFLFKWDKDIKDTRPVMEDAQDVFFANQVINNACATQAILSILMNRTDVDLGPTLGEFKDFAQALPPDMRGLAIGNSETIRTVHNSFARPEPFVSDEKVTAGDDDDVFHFIGYVPVNNALYELDGLKAGPIKLADCTMENWLDKARPAIQERIQKYSEKEIRFNLLALIKNRKETLTQRLAELDAEESRLRSKMDALVSGAGMDIDSDDLPNDEAELNNRLHRVLEERMECKAGIEAEEEHYSMWRTENARRKHNYVPFIFNLLKLLAKKGKLNELVEQGKKAEADARQRARKEKEKQKGAASAAGASGEAVKPAS